MFLERRLSGRGKEGTLLKREKQLERLKQILNNPNRKYKLIGKENILLTKMSALFYNLRVLYICLLWK